VRNAVTMSDSAVDACTKRNICDTIEQPDLTLTTCTTCMLQAYLQYVQGLSWQQWQAMLPMQQMHALCSKTCYLVLMSPGLLWEA
jgi:hypothetical protein